MSGTRRSAALLVIGMVLLLAAPGALAQAPGPSRSPAFRGSGGWDPAGAYGRLYDPAAAEVVSGQVVTVERVTPLAGMTAGLHLTLGTAAGVLSVHLGPAWFVENQDLTLSPGDRVEVRGSRTTLGGQAVLIAAEIHKDEATLLLRDASGRPAWSAVRRP